jgi:polysaccharide export outer membrane protein
MLMVMQLTSCITTHQTNYLQPIKNYRHAYKDTFSYQDYRLKEGDRLYIQVYSTDDKTNILFNGDKTNILFNGSQSNGIQNLTSSNGSSDNTDLYTYLVKSDGSITFPEIGEIYVKGKTIRESKEIIENAIQPILKINSVDVRMLNRTFSVIGAGKSGRFYFPREKVNIYQALAMIGDLGSFTDRTKIKILRISKKGTQIKVFDIRRADIIDSEFYYLEPDDVILLQPLKQEFFGATTFWMTLSSIITTVSFGAGVYYLIKPFIK